MKKRIYEYSTIIRGYDPDTDKRVSVDTLIIMRVPVGAEILDAYVRSTSFVLQLIGHYNINNLKSGSEEDRAFIIREPFDTLEFPDGVEIKKIAQLDIIPQRRTFVFEVLNHHLIET